MSDKQRPLISIIAWPINKGIAIWVRT